MECPRRSVPVAHQQIPCFSARHEALRIASSRPDWMDHDNIAADHKELRVPAITPDITPRLSFSGHFSIVDLYSIFVAKHAPELIYVGTSFLKTVSSGSYHSWSSSWESSIIVVPAIVPRVSKPALQTADDLERPNGVRKGRTVNHSELVLASRETPLEVARQRRFILHADGDRITSRLTG